MLSKNRANYIRSLQLKKRREEEGVFVVEGRKSALELFRSDFETVAVIATESFWKDHKNILQGRKWKTEVCRDSEMEGLSSFKTPQGILAVARIKPNAAPKKCGGLILALDRVSDPGNFGTLLRTADWFGASAVIASPDTTDFYNPKALQASMGSFSRVSVFYTDLKKYLPSLRLPVYAASREGKSAHGFKFEEDCVILLGSESHGVSEELKSTAKATVGIPAFGKAESLNVAAAAAVLCDGYRRAQA